MKLHGNNRLLTGVTALSIYPATSLGALRRVRTTLRKRTALEAIAEDFATVGRDIKIAVDKFENESSTQRSHDKLPQAS